MNNFFLISLLLIFFLTIFFNSKVEASNPNLFVSAENSEFDNHFEGSMVVEVLIIDNNIRDTDQGKGEPDVTINGKQLRMVQSSNGQWYAYFANVDLAKIADQIVLDNGIGAEGQSLDFGVFCGSNTDSTVLGASFSNTRGVAIPRIGGISGATNGIASFNACTGSPISSTNLNNVVREPKSVNTNPNIPTGQIGIDVDAWPLIQLFSFDNVEIKYNKAGGVQFVELDYDKIPNISHELDRIKYPLNAEVFAIINDIQLNQDPTDKDSWTFNINSTRTTFYQAFDENGFNAANGGPGLINLIPNLSNLNFNNNGILTMNLGLVVELKTNSKQPETFVSDGTTTYSQIVTLVESEPNSGVFEIFDENNESIIGILGNAPRGQTGSFTYNKQSSSILSGTFAGGISLETIGSEFRAGQKTPISLVDQDQNMNPGSRETLEVFRSTSIIPTLQIGNPVTYEKTSDVKFYASSLDPLSGGISTPSSVPDKNSKILVVDTTTSSTPFEKISMNLGITADTIQSLLIDVSLPTSAGTNWLNFDLRSFQNQLDINSFSDTSMTLHFGGLPGTSTVTILDPGDITSGKGFVPIDDSDVSVINTVSGSSSVFLEINFDSSDDSSSVGLISNEADSQPIVFDLFSFGEINNQEINNAIYRFELKETSTNSGTFTGTVQYTIANQLSSFDTKLIKSTIRTIDDKIHFAVTNRMIDNEGINIQYSDVEVSNIISKASKTDIRTGSGVVTAKSTFRFGHPVTIILNDPDLNVASDIIDIYQVVDDPNSPNVDTVGDAGGGLLLEILLKDIRYKRCTIDGKEVGGLASTGFSLIETGTSTGIFEGTFKMPTEICDKTGTKLITTAGGSVNAKYHDFRDSSGKPNIFSLSRATTTVEKGILPTLNAKEFPLPKYKQTQDVTLTGKISNYKSGTTIQLSLTGPDQSTEDLTVFATNKGEYKAVLTLYHTSQPGLYSIDVNYQNSKIGSVSFEVLKPQVPEWIKNNARWWSTNQISDTEFINGIEHLISENIITIPESLKSESSAQGIPSWLKNTASWWSENLVTDDEFLAALEFLVKNGIIRI